MTDLPAMADAAIEVTVLDVRPSRLNTVDGNFPVVDVQRSPDQLRGLLVYTEIEVRVEAVHGLRPDATPISVGDRLTITIDGGLVETVLPPDEAAALGIRVPVREPQGSPEDPERGDPRLEPASPLASTGEEPEIAPSSPTPYTTGITPFYSLTEGERVLMFVTETTQPGFGIPDFRTLEPTHPYGVFHQVGGRWQSDLAAAAGLDPVALANQIGRPAGP